MAFIKSGNVIYEDDVFRLDALYRSQYSLKNQSLPRPLKDGTKEIFDNEDLSGIARKYGNPDGWGIASYKSGKLIVEKGIKPAFRDKVFLISAYNTVKSKPNIILAHVRLASKECNTVEINNVHPFTYRNWSFIDNGTINGVF